MLQLYQIFLHGDLGRRLHAELVHQLGGHRPHAVLLARLGVRLPVLGRQLVANYL